MNKFAWLAFVLMLGVSQTAGAAIYKWKDKDGVTRYSDTPPAAGVPYESMGSKKSPSRPAADAPDVAAKPVQEQPQNAQTPPETPEQLQEKQRAEAENKKIRAQNCSAARANLQTYTQGGRISRMSETGEREYLDDGALARGAEQARKDIAEFCD